MIERHKNKRLTQAGVKSLGAFAAQETFAPGGFEKFMAGLEQISGQRNVYPPLAFCGASLEGNQVLAVCSADGVREVLTNTDVFAKSPEVYGMLSEMLGQGLATSEGNVWFDQRKRLTPMFHLHNLRSYTPLINEEGRNLAEKLRALSNGGTARLEVPPIFAATALNVIARAVFGERLDIERVGALWSVATAQLAPFFTGALFLPRAFIKLYPPARLFLDKCAELDALFCDVVDATRAAPSKEGAFDLVAQMALLKNEAGDWEIPKQLIVDECKTFTFAAQDTTSNLLSWTMYFLGQQKYAHIQDELLSELIEHYGVDGDVDEPSSLKLHRAVLQESLRLRPPVPSLDRVCVSDTILCGQPVEKGTAIHCMMMAPQWSAEHWESPQEFKPRRWLENAERHPYSFTAFSAGSRNCIGQKLAINEATILLACIVRSHRIHVENADQVVMAPKGTTEPHQMQTVFRAR